MRFALVLVNLRRGHWRLALTLLFMPADYELWNSAYRKRVLHRVRNTETGEAMDVEMEAVRRFRDESPQQQDSEGG